MSFQARIEGFFKVIVLVFLVLLASYGLMVILVNQLDQHHGERAVETVHPFVSGAASAAGDRMREALMATPDDRLEKDGEVLGRKLYPAVKGFLKGQMDGFAADPERKELGKKVFDASKELSKDVATPLGEKLQEQSQVILKDLDQTLQGVKRLRDDNKDLIDGLTSGLEALRNRLKQSGPTPQ
ncbi:MAG: hypothetical protein QG577_475 [Thermodesulfobacteriota bacterium]|nr:hypothetical protein [Thermodesulfobacteriota bacterium]